jgi:nucleotide-binding universal stress UspA family protein
MEGRLTGSGGGPGRIVVGVDGSERSRDALRWAARQAELTRATLDVIAASQFPAFYGWTPADLVGPDFARFAEQALTDTVGAVFGADGPAWLRSRVVEGHAGQVLVEASAGAELLVVGNRGYGGFTVCCSVRSAPTAFTTRAARSPSSGPPGMTRGHRHPGSSKADHVGRAAAP